MSLTIHPDPQEPAGGFAFLKLEAGSLGKGPVGVAVMEVYGRRWLGPTANGGKVTVGAANWQAERFEFGPYPVQAHDGADWLRIGPEIVNKIDEYTPLRLFVAGQGWDVTWPDNVPPRAGAAVLGGLLPTARSAPPDSAETAGAAEALVGKPPEPEPPEPPEQVVLAATGPHRRNLWLPALLILLLIGALVAAWVLIPRDDPPGDSPVAENSCTRAALRVLDGYAATEQAIRACGDALSPDMVLEIIEDAAAQGDGDALLLFGTLYDGAELDQRIETVIGLSFDHNAAKAAEYYARAVAAGSEAARSRLVATCAQLAGSNATLAKGAYDDFCG